MRAMEQAAIVPIRESKLPIFHATRVHNFQVLPLSQQGDITDVWLSN